MVVDSHDQIIGKKRFDSFLTEDQIKDTIRGFVGWSAYVWKCYEALPFK